MPTPAERKALMFIAAVALLGASVRAYRAFRHGSPAEHAAREPGSVAGSRAPYSRARPPHGRRRAPARRPIAPPGTTIDLDRASADEIDAIGALPPGTGRLIVADRERNGPFGSLAELARIPVLTAASIRKLAPRVTFSRLPRPKNAILQSQPERHRMPARRRRRGRSQEPVVLP